MHGSTKSDAPSPEHVELLDAMPFARLVGIRLTSARVSEMQGTLEWAADRCTAGGMMHGAALVALADSIGAICAFLNLQPGESTSTIESKTNFFRPVRSGCVEATSRPLHVGRRTIVVQTDIVDGQRRLVAQVTQTQSVLPASPPRDEATG